MADEKQTTSDIDDWLEDLEDSDEFSAELDQDNIDALLSGGSDDQPEEMDLSADDDGDLMQDLDQDNIDALLGGGMPDAPVEEKSAATELEESGDLDQDNIDALLGGGMPDTPVKEKSAATEPEESGDLDQDNIDALLGGGMPDTPVKEKSAATELEESGDLDQDNIDALLGGISATPAEATSPQEIEELDQANIDALLGGEAVESAAEEVLMVGESGESSELEQDNIDALFDGASGSTSEKLELEKESSQSSSEEFDQDNIDLLLGGDESAGEIDQANIDALLGGLDDNEKSEEKAPEAFFVDEEKGTSSSLDVDQDEIDQLFSGLDDDDDDSFDSGDMDIADVLGSDDDFLDLGDEYGVDETAAALLGASATAGTAGTAFDRTEQTVKEGGKIEDKKGFLPFLPAAINKTVASVVVACLVLIIGLGLFFFMPGGEKEAVLPDMDGQQLAQLEEVVEEEPATQQIVKNTVPDVSDSSYQMPETGGEVAILLSASDIDSDQITYDVVNKPQHGRLSGEKPSLVYLPNSDFPGQDIFQYTASDGQGVSRTASVIITGPNLQQTAELVDKKEEVKEQEAKTFTPRGQAVAAKNLTYKTKSTDGITIDWAKIWREANYSPFNSKVFIDIDKSGLSGSLTRLSKDVSKYIPDPFFDGQEVLYYRFKHGGLSSARGKMVIDVELGNPAPQIRLSELANQYQVGQTVTIDVSSTRDEARETLEFVWEQVGGTPVPVEKINDEGSSISFIMPSAFYTEPEPGPVLRVTAVDETGKSDTMDIKVKMVSRRKTALWRGSGRGLAADPPLDGRRLPWPYYD